MYEALYSAQYTVPCSVDTTVAPLHVSTNPGHRQGDCRYILRINMIGLNMYMLCYDAVKCVVWNVGFVLFNNLVGAGRKFCRADINITD